MTLILVIMMIMSLILRIDIMRSHWLDIAENKEDNKYELSQYQKELEKSYTEKIEIERKLKAINYRILQLKEYITDLT